MTSMIHFHAIIPYLNGGLVAYNKMDLHDAYEKWESFRDNFRSRGIEPVCISAINRDGTRELITATYELVRQGIEDRKDEKMVKKQRTAPVNDFEISHDSSSDTWHIEGADFQQFVQMTNWNHHRRECLTDGWLEMKDYLQMIIAAVHIVPDRWLVRDEGLSTDDHSSSSYEWKGMGMEIKNIGVLKYFLEGKAGDGKGEEGKICETDGHGYPNIVLTVMLLSEAIYQTLYLIMLNGNRDVEKFISEILILFN
ncbi:GTP-binding protein OBGC, chloroplastic-like protein [Tanacetum coccineum]